LSAENGFSVERCENVGIRKGESKMIAGYLFILRAPA